jgi:predicted Zn finger-like uncharacterized protein
MKIECPKCGHRGQVDDARIPVSGAMSRCPRCKERFAIQRSEAAAADSLANTAEAMRLPEPLGMIETTPPTIAHPHFRNLQNPRSVPDNKWWRKPLIYSAIWLVIVIVLFFAVVWFAPDSPAGGMTDEERSELLGIVTMGWFIFGTVIIWYQTYRKKGNP